MVHFITIHKKIIVLLSLLTMAAIRVGAVPVHINSGNPAYPFPQFLEYAYGDSHRLGNLATRNPEGVVHAEMEQDIRDAYQVHANEFEYTGKVYKGIKYIHTPSCGAGYYGCTESQGYGLLAAAFMADKVTFDGYWMWVHDSRNRTKSYDGCADIAPDYLYGPFAISDGATAGGNTAADGDVDVALALYVAYKQWGEFMRDEAGNIITDACGEPISYKKEMTEVIRGLVAMSAQKYLYERPIAKVQTGCIGVDGYMNGGDTWDELTGTYNEQHPMVAESDIPIYVIDGRNMEKKILPKGTPFFKGTNIGPAAQHIDYYAPSYFREFRDLLHELAEEGYIDSNEWEEEQYRRGEASSDWLIGQLLEKSQYSVPTAGYVEVSDDGSSTKFYNFGQGEDFRCAWRTIANYVWHGNPEYTWDPVSHTVKEGGNTFEHDAAVRMSAWMNDPSNWNTGTTGPRCISFGSIKNLPYSGPFTIRWQNDPNTGISTEGQDFYCSLSMAAGAGAFAAIGAQDYELMGLTYRECNTKWYSAKQQGTGDLGFSYPPEEKNNVGMIPDYMHGWFRQIGMMVLSGNAPAPSMMRPIANMKIYRAIKDSVTFCYTGDEITYLLDYRNYGSVDAEDVVIVENVPKDFDVVRVDNGGVYDAASRTITWKIGMVSGYHSDGNEEGYLLDVTSPNLKKTLGQVSYQLRASSQASGRYCTTAKITCSNGLGWVTNEYPNYRTATMQRNCVDVIKRSLEIEKSVDREKINPGNVATYSIHIKNTSDVGWIDGGRPRVTASWACEVQSNETFMKFRLFHDAVESYINYGNYRFSYYLYDPVVTGLGTGGWGLSESRSEGTSGFKLSHETIVEGDSLGHKWNQRLCVTFNPQLVATTMLTAWNASNATGGDGTNGGIHKGGSFPLQVSCKFNGNNFSDKVDWTDDWSYGDYVDSNMNDGLYFPITPSSQRTDENGKTIIEPINKWLTCGCTESNKTVDNILVEEYDGYVWRRVLGNGPMSGRDVDSVYVLDTLPKGLEFVSFVGDCPLEEYGAKWETSKTTDGLDVVKWFIPKMQVKHEGVIKYHAIATFPSGKECQTEDEKIINAAWILGSKNSPAGDTASLIVTCGKVPDPIIPTTMSKVSDKENYEVGDDISYEIEYEQTHGAVFDDAGKTSSNWELKSVGYGTSIENGVVSLSQGASAQHKYSYSSNIFVKLDCKVNQGSSETDAESFLYFRDNIKVGIFVNYDGGGATVLKCYRGNNLLKTVTLASKKTSFKLNVDLNGDVLRLWIDKDTSKLKDFIVEGLPLSSGYFGIVSPSNGSSSFSNIHIHTDYAYDLTIVDRKPAEVDFVSADNGGVLQGDSIVWKFEQGIDHPIPFGTKYNVSWNGKVTECSESIINVAYTKLLGHKDNEIMSQAVSGCGEACPLPNVTLTISDNEICAGDSATLVAGPTGSYTYMFFEDGVLLDSTASNIFVTKPIAAGRYKYFVKVVSRLTLLPCYSPSDTLILSVEKLPKGSNFDLGTFCKGNADVTSMDKEINNMIAEGVTYSWFDADDQPTTLPDINDITAPGDYNFSYSLNTQSGCESKTLGQLKFTVKEITPPTGTGVVSYLLGDTAANGSFDKNLIQQDPSAVDLDPDYTYLWFDENGQQLQGPPTPSVPSAGSTVTSNYYVKRTQPVGCVSDSLPVTVIVSGSSVPVPDNVTYCLNESALPISATASEVNNSTATWEVVYYDADGNELTSDADRTPSTATAGTITYYVSQREVGNPTNESGKVPLTVTVVEITTPDISMNRTQYCKGEEYEQLQVKSTSSLYDANKSSFSWSVDGQSVTGVPLAQTQTEVVSYGVVERYEIDANHVCVSDTAKFAVQSTFVPVATGSLSVNYLKQEAAADGSFESLLTKDPSAVSASDNTDYELVWYDKDLNELGTTDPTPMKDNSWEENKDVNLVYFVKQRHKDSGCLSDTVRVSVIISDALVPNTFPMNYCHHAKASSLEYSASINTNKGQVKDIDYELVWFSPEDNYAAPLAAAPVPSTETVGVTIYKVAQKQKSDGSVSSKADVKVTVFPIPEIKVDALPQTCGEEIDITKYIHLANVEDTSTLYFYANKGCSNRLSDAELSLAQSKVFYANAYYTIFSEPNIVGVCSSDTMEVNATIDDLSNLVVDAPLSVCPNGDIHLKASATSTTATVSYVWSGDATGNDDVLDTKDETGIFGKVYKYVLTASAGACRLDTTVFVTVGRGELTGDVLANGQATHNFKTCGGETIELSTTHEGTDYKWTDLSGNSVGDSKNVSVSPTATTTYVVSLVNKCETSDTIVVEVYPLSLTADFSLLDTTICENLSASAALTITGYDASMPGAYIKWLKDNNELTEFAGQTSLQLDNVRKSDGGEYTYEVSNGICLAKTTDVKTTAKLNVQPFVTFDEPATVEVPHGGSADLTISGLTPSDATVTWSGTTHSGSGNPFEVTDMVSDELFTVTLSADGYCDSETELQVLVDAKAVVSISVSADIVCVEDGVTVTADTTGTGHLMHPDLYQLTWYSLDAEGNLSKLTGNDVELKDYPQASVSYFAEVTYGSQKATSDTLSVEIVTPAIYTVTEDAVSCSGDEVTIEVSSDDADVEVEWTEDGSKDPSIVVAPTESRSYEFTISKKGLCPVKDQIPVSVKEKPSITMDEEKTVCEGSDIVISPAVTGKEYSGFEWTDPEGTVVSTDLKLVMAPTMSGAYTLLVETASCGNASASIQVKVIPTPVLYIDSLSFSSRKVDVVSGGAGMFEYKMDNQDWQADNLYDNLAFNVLHTAYARDEMGCVGMTVFNVTQPPVPIPDYFTPDGTGENDVWDLTPIMDAYPKTTVKIFDRTGKVVAELEGSEADWDGTYNGNPLPSTDYWYLINVPEIRQQFTGHFTLIRSK